MKRFCSAILGLCLLAAACTSPPGWAAASSAASAAASQVEWVRYEDPAERAIALQVPQGWNVQGGLYRFGYFDARWMIDARSPDAGIILRLDDANIPAYALPGAHTPPEGQPYNKPQEFQMVVARYRAGQAFAETYAKFRFNSVCQSMTPQASGWKPSVPAIFREMKSQQETEGSVAYECATSQGPRVAVVYARTSEYGVYGGGFWTADPVVSILTTAGRLPESEAIAQHMLDTVEKNPQWVAYQNRLQQEGLAAIKRDFQSFMAQMQAYHQARTNAWNQQVAGFEARQNAQAEQSAKWGEILTGLQEVRDPSTGNTFQVWSGPNANYYRNGVGTTVNSNTLPGPDYHQVQPTH